MSARGFQRGRRAFPIGLLAVLVGAAVWLGAVGTSAQAQGVSGYTEVTGAAVTVPGFTSATGSATCPAGDVVFSGGYTLVGGNMVIDTSAPLGANGAISSTTWTVTGFDNGDGQGTFTPYAICVSSSIAGYSEASKGQSVSAGSSAQLTETCPAGSVITGGGFAAGSTAPVINESDPTSSSTVSSTTWTVFVNNSGSRTAQSVTTYVVCVSNTISGYSEQLAQSPNAGVVGATCPSGSLVIGGGVSAPGPPNTSVDAPVVQNAAGAFVVSNTTWSVDAASTGGGVIGSIAICAAPAPTVNSLKPSIGPAAGGNTIAVVGSNFTGATAVSFGSTPATSFSVVSSAQIDAVVPAGSGAVDVTVTTPGGTSPTVSGDIYKYVPSVTSVSPTSGPTTGGTTVTINGTGFTGATGVSFGGMAASFAVKSSTQVSATAPPGAAGTVDITVTTAGGTSATSTNDQYTYVTPPTVTQVTPSSGPAAGGTSVTITGTSFTGATAVSFGGTAATTFTVNSATSITATSPAGSGAVDVTVTIPGGGKSATNSSDVFKYAPSVTGVSPASGPTAGGTSVTINGTGFTGATAVNFGANAATGFTVNSATQITATAPAGAAGTVDVTVTTSGGTSATGSPDKYTFVAPPTVTSVSPTAGPTAGGTNVTITGTNFTNATAVSFGAVAATSFTVSSDTQITAVAPAQSAAVVHVTVTTPSGTSATSSADQFTYQAPPTATITSPPPSQTYALNQVVATSFSCTEGANGPGIQSCTDSGGATNGTGTLNTANIGAHTYTVTAISKDGQGATKSVNYTVIGPPTATISSPANNGTYNLNQSVSTTFSCADSINGPGIQTCTDSNGASGGTGALDTTTAGAHTYTVIATSKDGQTATKSINYTVIGPPTAAITAPANNQTYNLNQVVSTTFSCTEATGGPGIQTCADSNGASGGTGALSTSTAGAHTYTVTATSKDGQTGTASISYTVAAPPTAAISAPANNQTYNLNQVVATAFTCSEGANGPGIQTCADSGGASNGAGTLNTSTTGAHSYTVTATSKDGQTGTATINYTVIGPPTATISTPADNQTYNLGQSVSTTFSCTEASGGPGIQTCKDSGGATGGAGTLDTTTGGVHAYTVTATSKDGQTGTATIHYTVIGGPTATISAPANNQTYNLGAVVATTFTCADAAGGPGIQTCTDSNGASGGSGTLNTSTAGAHTYTVTATSKDGQSGTASINYTVIGPPTAAISTPANNQTYNQNAVVATAFSCTEATGGPGIQSCVDSNNVTGGVGALNTATTGAHTYTVTATSKDGQTGTATINYTVIGPPTATISAPANNQTYNLNAAVATTFSCTDATGGPGIQSCLDSNNVTGGTGALNTATAGAHTYTVTATSKDGQTATKTINYTVIGPPTATITAPANNQAYNLNQSVSTTFSCAEASGGPGIQSCVDSNNVTGGTGALNTASAGAHTYTVTATSQDGQTATKSINYTVIGPPTATITAPANNQAYNLNQVVSTTFSCTDATGGPGIQTCTDSNGASGGTGTLDTSTPGAHTYTVTATSKDGQTATKTINYTIAGPPTAHITAPADNQTYNLGQAVATAFSCADDVNGPGIQTCADSHGGSNNAGTLDTSTAGAHTYTVTATSKDGLTRSTTIHYTVIGPPTPTITSPADNHSYAFGQAVATAFSCTDDANGPGIQTCADSGGASNGIGALNTGTTGAHTYTVTATSKDGQSATATIHYTVAAALAPAVTGGGPSAQTSSGATPSGIVNPEGMPTQAFFEYGLDLSQRGPGASNVLYDQSTPAQQVGSDQIDHIVSAPLTGLLPGALYHVRLVAVSSAGTTFGQDQTFTTAQAAAPPPPVVGQSEDVKPVSGKVFIKGPNGQFIPLTGGTQIPTGSVIDALHGSLQVTAAVGKGKTNEGTFGGAVFKLTQAHSGLTTLHLLESAFKGAPTYAICKAHKAADATAAALSSKTLQLLKANAHGKFSTSGKYSAATVRGTKWTVADRCDGTLTHVITDSVAVNDFVRHKTLILHAGQSYLARAPR